MKRNLTSVLWVLGLLAASGSATGRAQTTPTTPTTPTVPNTPVFSNGMTVELVRDQKVTRQISNTGVAYINIENCAKDDLKFTLKSGALGNTLIQTLEIWVGQNVDCSASASRQMMLSSGGMTSCWYVGSTPGALQGSATLTFPVHQLFSRKGQSCDPVTASSYTVYFVPLQTPTSSNQNMPPAPIALPGGVPKASFKIYNVPPDPPGNVHGESGGRSLTVKWTGVASAIAGTKYEAFFDVTRGTGGTGTGGTTGSSSNTTGSTGSTTGADGSSTGAGGSTTGAGSMDGGADASASGGTGASATTGGATTGGTSSGTNGGTDAGSTANSGGTSSVAACGTGLLVPKEIPPFSDDPLIQMRQIVAGGVSAGKADTLGDLDALGVPIGGYVAAAVATVDIAGNRGGLSDVVCVQRVMTNGFYDAYKADHGNGLTTCSVGAPRKTGLGNFAWLAGLTLVFAMRRRRPL